MSAQLAMYGLLQSVLATNPVSQRVYPDRLPDSPALPALTYQLVGKEVARAATRPGLASAEFIVAVYGTTRLSVESIANVVAAALDQCGVVVINGVRVDNCLLLNQIDLHEPETNTSYTHLKLKIHYRL